jgi:hypothetical protein
MKIIFKTKGKGGFNTCNVQPADDVKLGKCVGLHMEEAIPRGAHTESRYYYFYLEAL